MKVEEELKKIFFTLLKDQKFELSQFDSQSKFWDSMFLVTLIIEIEKYYSVTLTSDDLEKFHSFRSIVQVLEQKLDKQ